MSEKPPYFERIVKARSGIRWCLSCSRYTDGTYVHAPGQPGNGNLCGPGCFKHCEEEHEIRPEPGEARPSEQQLICLGLRRPRHRDRY